MSRAVDLAALVGGAPGARRPGVDVHVLEGMLHGVEYAWASAGVLVANAAADAADTDEPALPSANAPASPAALASRIHHRMVHAQQPQGVLYAGASGAGKTRTARRLTRHLVNLGAPTARLRAALDAALTVLDAFTCAPTERSAAASRAATYIELHYTPVGQLGGAKLLVCGLDKGATRFCVSDMDMRDVRAALRALGLRERTADAVERTLHALAQLESLAFVDAWRAGAAGGSALVADDAPLAHAAALLGVDADSLGRTLVARTTSVRGERQRTLLDARGAAAQRDRLVRSIYAVLVAYLVEAANQRIAPRTSHALHVVQLDAPGCQTGADFDAFCKNYMAELVHHYSARMLFDTKARGNAALRRDGVELPHVPSALYVEPITTLRGSVVSLDHAPRPIHGVLGEYARAAARVRAGEQSEDDDASLLAGIDRHYDSRALIPAPPGAGTFDVCHQMGAVTYAAAGHVAAELDALDMTHIDVLRSASDPFIARLFAGPALVGDVAGGHVHWAQVSSQPLRMPTPLRGTGGGAPREAAGVTAQVDAALLEMLRTLFAADHVWRVVCVGAPLPLTRQLRGLLVPQLLVHEHSDYIEGMPVDDFVARYADVLAECVPDDMDAHARVHHFVCMRGWVQPRDFCLGTACIWLKYGAWLELERRYKEVGNAELAEQQAPTPALPQAVSDWSVFRPASPTRIEPAADLASDVEDASLLKESETAELGAAELGAAAYIAPPDVWRGAAPLVAAEPEPRMRRWWVRLTWALTWWMPSSLLRLRGMRRPDVQFAWREKVAICTLIALFCALVLFYIIGFGHVLCPDFDRAWNKGELGAHDKSTSYYVAVQGEVYDLTKFYRRSHSDIKDMPTDTDTMMDLAGKDLTAYFPVPLVVGCAGLVTDNSLALSVSGNLSADMPQAVHVSGPAQPHKESKLAHMNWYFDRFRPRLHPYKKGAYVYDTKDLEKNSWRKWAHVDGRVYDLTNYFYTLERHPGDDAYRFLDERISDIFDAQPGADVSDDFKHALDRLAPAAASHTRRCLDNVFYVGQTDFRKSARCVVQNYLLLSFSCLIFASLFAKFVSALQLVRTPTPEQQERFVICHVPCYTEDEDSLRKTIDSLAAQEYDDKRKLLFIVCDGMITGGGNDRSTPRIVLDIFGVDPRHDPTPLPFKSIAEGSKQLNYGKVYSGLYEYEGHVVPYLVVVKVGRPSERSRPGNRGKRDTQVLLMRILNRAHFDAPMSPLELEVCHQMTNVIGIAPVYYEFVLMVDADTFIMPDGMNRLVAAACDDRSVIGICGETMLDNAGDSWWTMIQVYEYYISHNLAKAFESLFGSVTCLPGCFSMYRVRTADRGRPLFVSDRVIDDYSENRIDTLHKKNLFSLGEDRYLTTLLLKHFPTFRTRFLSHATALTAAPSSFSVLLSQRRRWINSTVHNLVELVRMDGLCGFCLFSMRFIVFIDLIGTIILPATTIYLVYLIVTVSVGDSPIPVIAIALIAGVYGLQAIIFLLRMQWQYLGWMVIYLLAFPLYAFFLPIYSFWHMDDFSWGNTRIVVGEKGHTKIVAGTDDEPFHDAMIPLKRFTQYEQELDQFGYDDRPLSCSVRDSQALPTPARSSWASAQYSAAPTPAYPSWITMPDPWHAHTSAPLAEIPDSDVSDAQLAEAVRAFIAAQPSLMTVTKRDVRRALMVAMPNVDLARHRQRISELVDEILSSK